MKATRLTSRYAKSLLSLSIEQNSLDKLLSDMNYIKNICSENKDLVLLLKSPVVKTDKKLSILSEIFSSFVSEITMTFINIITFKKREKYLEGIAESFISLYKIHNNIETVTLTTSHPVDEKTKCEVLDFVKKNGQQNVEITQEIDEELLGGMIIRIGDKQLDASVSRDIKKLKKLFNKNLYIKEF
ncbi:MAG: ATP synthase F1 subunit delta [Flavobacteriales bacterium]|nr:ATP synthase F1 subunit delta [Flavobacteriales bacterium]